MSEPFQFEYYYGAESDQFSFIRIPKLLLKDPRFMDLSYGAIITYAVLLDRMNLSIKNGWHDEKNRVFIRYKVADLTDVIGRTDDTVSKYLKELEDIGLIERPRRGLGKGKVTYVKNFISPELRDGDLIPRESSGNGKDENSKKECNYCKTVDNSTLSDTPESTKIHIPRESSGNVPRENSGNIAGESSGNVPRDYSAYEKNNNEINNKYINNNYLNQNHITVTVNTAGSDNDEDWMTYREIIKDITTSTLSAYQLGQKYKLSKMTIDRIGRDHLGTDIYSRREKLAFASLCAQIKELSDRNYSLTSIADQLGISKSSIFDISKKMKSQASEEATSAEDNEVQVISIESKVEGEPKLPAGRITPQVAREAHPAKN